MTKINPCCLSEEIRDNIMGKIISPVTNGNDMVNEACLMKKLIGIEEVHFISFGVTRK